MTKRFVIALRPWRVPILIIFDSAAWIFSIVVLSYARWQFAEVDGFVLSRAFVVGACAAVLHVLVGLPVRLHQGRTMMGSIDEMLHLGIVVGVVGAAVTMGNLLAGHYIPATVPFTATFAALVIMAWGRAMFRTLRDGVRQTAQRDLRQTAVVMIGAGDAGHQLIRSMLLDPSSHWRPVALVDDDPRRRHLKIRGIRVMGDTEQLAAVARRTEAEAAIVAIPSASAETIRALTTLATEAGLAVKVLPSTNHLLDPSRVGVSDVRDLDVADLLGRRQINTDLAAIAGYLRGKRVLVTGAGGSIGAELSRQLIQFHPAELILLDRDESALHGVELSIHGRALLDKDNVVLADIRDADAIRGIFARRRPHVVFHAAALKHLPMLEQYPAEGVKTNVWGTLNVLRAAQESGVERFINVSTDKAADPTSVLGYTKRLAEGLTAAVAHESEGTFLSVRFGNVLASRGSVLTSFASQIAAGGPVTVTDPRVTRYFMTAEEAVQLVIQAGAIGSDGEALILDMGAPVSIDRVARQLIQLDGREIDIQYTGLRQGEKLHEQLLGTGEDASRSVHPLIIHALVPAVNTAETQALDTSLSPENLTRLMSLCCESMSASLVAHLGPA